MIEEELENEDELLKEPELGEDFKSFDLAIRAKIEALQTEKYIHTPMNRELWFLLEDLMLQVNHRNPKPKLIGCLVTGPPHSGKTTGTRQFKKAYLENIPGAKDQDIVMFQIPSRAQFKGVIYNLGNVIKIPGLPLSSKAAYNRYLTFTLVEMVAQKLWNDGTKLVIIDEFQKLFELSTESRVEILSGFNDLVNESHVPIALVGVNGVDKILDLEQYEDLSNLKGTFCSRFPEFKIMPWLKHDDVNFLKLLRTIHSDCELDGNDEGREFYKDETIRKRILEMTGGLTGKIIQLIKRAARDVIRYGEDEIITMEVLERAFSAILAKGW